jgi:adenylate cyclase
LAAGPAIRTLALRPILLSAISGLVLLAAGSLLAIEWFTSRAVLAELADRLERQHINALERAIEDHLDPARELAAFLAKEIAEDRYGFEDEAQLKTLVLGSLAAAPQVKRIMVFDASLNALRVVRDFEGASHLIERFDASKDQGVIDVYREAVAAGVAHWGPLLFGERVKQTLMNVRAPIVDAGKVEGVLTVAVAIDELSRFIETMGKQGEETTFILYGDLGVLAHPRLREHLGEITAQAPVLSRQRLGDEVISSLAKAEPIKLLRYGVPKDTGFSQLRLGQQTYYVFTRMLRQYGAVPLTIGSYSTDGGLEHAMRRVRSAGIVGLAVLLLGVAGAMVLSRTIARPIRSASEAAAAVGSMDFERLVPMRRSFIRELDELARSFNRMLEGLRTFGRYVPRRLVNQLIAEGRVGAGSEERVLTVMFTDMRGFSSISEGLSPKEVADFLNRHLTMLTECVEAEGGTVDKFIGDAVMAFWGAPEAIENTALAACRAALRMKGRIAEDNAGRSRAGLPPIGLRVGIHTGPLVVGDIGSPSRINYTVVGDVVNASQRLESLGKEVDPDAETVILVSRETRDALKGGLEADELGEFHVKGRQKPMTVYRLKS